jgi:hypothetical protein
MSVRESIYAVRRISRISARIREFGIKIESKRVVDRMWDEQWRGSELIDAKVTYKYVCIVSGNTFPARDALKAFGFRWNAAGKCWQRNGQPTGLCEALVAVTVQR